MPEKQKLIGVCLSQAHTYINSGYIAALEKAARPEGYRVVVFNTALDFYWYKQGNTVARSIFRAIHYEDFSALVVVHESFHDPQLLDEIVREAGKRGVPMFCLGAVWEGCVSILFDYYAPYKELLRHVIREHGARDTFYISGIEGESNSALRVQCYREVLEEEGLPWNRENVGWGLFCEDPAREIVENLIRTREKMPEVIFCANDYMAMTVCETLAKHGFRVPEEVKVTGFDGIPIAKLFTPQLTTCSQDTPALAKRTMELALALQRGETVDPVQHHPYRPVFSESGGCPAPERDVMDALMLFQRMEEQNSQENHLYHTVERMLMQDNMHDLLLVLSEAIPAHSAVYLNRSFLTSEQSAEYDLDHLEPVLMKVSHQNLDAKSVQVTEVPLCDLAREGEEGAGLSILTAIHSDTTVCGCIMVHTDSLEDQNQNIKRLGDVLNLTFSVILGNVRQKKLLTHLENSLYLDPFTGMPNLKGLNRWFESWAAEPGNHDRCVALSLYHIHRYDYLYETYGISDAEEIIRFVSSALRDSNPEALQIARINEKQFVLVNDAADMAGISEVINRCVHEFFRRKESYNVTSGKAYYLEVNCGCTTMETGWKAATLGNLIQLATGEMYLNRMRSGSHEAVKSIASPDARMYKAFLALIGKNLFRYHFQPIVNARTGQIVAYEALMRTDPAIGLNPMQILEIAREYDHLYEVEKLTLFGIMERYAAEYSHFYNNQIFINTIPGHFLTPGDCQELMTRFEPYLDCFIFELTEQDTTTDEELARLKRLHKAGEQTRIAIDDYGTGHSNIINLLRYAPQIIKIDRALISGIQNDGNRQLFLRNTIEFAHQNGIQALAEGVETSEELRYVIDCGVDLIQGFYTARPAEEPIPAIPEAIRDEILEENLRIASEDTARRVYFAKDGESIHLIDLALHNYTELRIPAGEVTLIGETAHIVDMNLRMEDGAVTRINLDHVSLRGEAEAPIRLGSGCRLTLNLLGQNMLYKEGIRVPADAELKMAGSGSLRIMQSRNSAVGIGASWQDAYGTIEMEMDGRLDFQASGDKVVCLGGGRSEGRGIQLRRGELLIEARGTNTIGIGSTAGAAVIRAEKSFAGTVRVEGDNAIAMGTIAGEGEIYLAGDLNLSAASERAVGLGTTNGQARMEIRGGNLDILVKCDVGTCLGSFTGEALTAVAGGNVRIHGEGNRVCGIGSLQGTAETKITGGRVSGELLAGEKLMMGNERSRCDILGGDTAGLNC